MDRSASDAATHRTRPDYRREKRKKIDTEAVIRNNHHERIGGAVFDISESGCRVDLFAGSAQPGQYVTIKLNAFESWSGIVRWARGTQIGVEFARGLHPAVVEHIAHTHAVVEID